MQKHRSYMVKAPLSLGESGAFKMWVNNVLFL